MKPVPLRVKATINIMATGSTNPFSFLRALSRIAEKKFCLHGFSSLVFISHLKLDGHKFAGNLRKKKLRHLAVHSINQRHTLLLPAFFHGVRNVLKYTRLKSSSFAVSFVNQTFTPNTQVSGLTVFALGSSTH